MAPKVFEILSALLFVIAISKTENSTTSSPSGLPSTPPSNLNSSTEPSETTDSDYGDFMEENSTLRYIST